jgi:hypothetical protein
MCGAIPPPQYVFKVWYLVNCKRNSTSTLPYDSETWYITAIEEHDLQNAENRTLRKINGSKKEQLKYCMRNFVSYTGCLMNLPLGH